MKEATCWGCFHLIESVMKLALKRRFINGIDGNESELFKGPLSGLRRCLTAESSLKIMGNDFCVMLKALSVFEIFTLLSWLSDYVENGLKRRLRLTPKFLTSQAGRPIITIHILPNISKSKSNQVIKFFQLIEYNVRNIFLQKSLRKSGRETSSRSRLVF